MSSSNPSVSGAQKRKLTAGSPDFLTPEMKRSNHHLNQSSMTLGLNLSEDTNLPLGTPLKLD